MKTTTSWPQDTWNVNICSFGWEICKFVECPKMTFFSQVRFHEKLQFFRLSKKSFKIMKNTTSWPQDTWNVNICSFGWKICKFVKCPKMTLSRRSWKSSIFWLFKKPFKLMKTTISWLQETWNVNICSFGWEICKFVKCPKMTFFSQVHGHEKLQFFRLSRKYFKMMKTTTSWPQDTYNVNICSFGWEICKFVKCPKWHFSRRAGVMKTFNFFDSPKSLSKWWKTPPVDPSTHEM